MGKISVVVPVYGCKTMLIELYLRVKKTCELLGQEFELILVNDNCPENSWEIILELCSKDTRVIGINLSRNFGQHYAIFAGLEHSCGEWIVVMDCDLQDKPEEITLLYKKVNEGFDAVLGQRTERKDNIIKKIGSKAFYTALSYLTNTTQDSTIANFGIYNRKMINALLSMGDSMKYFPTMIKWVGFKQTTLKIEHTERISGKTSYSFKKLLNLGLDVMLSFSDKPLRLTVKFGVIISMISMLIALFYFISYLTGHLKITGFASLIISIWFLAGVVIFLIGILGLYIGKSFENSKNRPTYIIMDIVNKNAKN